MRIRHMVFLVLVVALGVGAGVVKFIYFPAAEPVAAESPENAVTDTRAFGDWAYGCRQVATQKLCSLRQWVKDQKSGATIFTWIVEQNGKGGFAGAWAAPSGILLRHGLTLNIGAEKPVLLPFESCGRAGCVVKANMDAGFIARLAAASTLQASFVAASGKPLTIAISAKGLAEGLAALK